VPNANWWLDEFPWMGSLVVTCVGWISTLHTTRIVLGNMPVCKTGAGRLARFDSLIRDCGRSLTAKLLTVTQEKRVQLPPITPRTRSLIVFGRTQLLCPNDV
jgi:hypothetical protein